MPYPSPHPSILNRYFFLKNPTFQVYISLFQFAFGLSIYRELQGLLELEG